MKSLAALTLATSVVAVTVASIVPAASSWTSVKPPILKTGDPLPANIFVELAKAINPGVVNIATSALPRSVQRDPMLDMLERFYGQSVRPQQDNKPHPIGLGTGFVVREDGLIVTNAHVIHGADLVSVQFTEASDKTYDAQILGFDERSDIALLKVKVEHPVTALALGSSDKTEVGEWVAAFGNPFGHGHTMTKGIISSKGRSIEEINKFPLLQTDAPINPGNSGGPLLNMQGEVIGVNSAINAMAQGISFAIPIDQVKSIIQQLENHGSLRQGYIGVGLGEIVSSNGDEPNGAGIASIDPKGPAAKAGIKPYDIITEFNGHKIRNPTELRDAVADSEPGKKVKVHLLREAGSRVREMTLDVAVTEHPKQPALNPAARSEAPAGQDAPYNLGFSMQNMNDDLREELNLPEELTKPVIVAVRNGSAAAFVGIRPGDVILEINRHEVTSVMDATKNFKKGENILKLARGNRILIVSMGSK